jgi:kinesin family protein 15
MNKESSRSHTVFTVTIQTKSASHLSLTVLYFCNTFRSGTSGGLTKIKTSRLNLVDLAGSERQKAAQTEGQALKEASQINKSLSAIGNVRRHTSKL